MLTAVVMAVLTPEMLVLVGSDGADGGIDGGGADGGTDGGDSDGGGADGVGWC